jgi:hypothetical protein
MKNNKTTKIRFRGHIRDEIYCLLFHIIFKTPIDEIHTFEPYAPSYPKYPRHEGHKTIKLQ